MAMSSDLAWLIAEIERQFGRMTAELQGALFLNINRAVDRLTRRYKFWFMNVEPGTDLAFPITTLSSETLGYERWRDKGWLITVEDRYDYLYAMPEGSLIQPDPTGDGPNVSTPTRWRYAEIANLNYVHFYDEDGVYRSEIQIVPEAEWWRRANLKTSGLPRWVCFKTEVDGVSHLLFSPKPDDTYLFQVGVRLATLPPLDRPQSTHAMLMYYPHVMLTIGLMETAAYFKDQQTWMMYRADLMGANSLQQDNPNFTPGGMIGEMIADTRNRGDNKYLTTRTYTSSAAAFGRSGPRRNTRGRYYTTS